MLKLRLLVIPITNVHVEDTYDTRLSSPKWSTLCLKKNDTGVAGYIFNAHQPILVVFGRDVGERVCYWMVICYPTSPN